MREESFCEVREENRKQTGCQLFLGGGLGGLGGRGGGAVGAARAAAAGGALSGALGFVRC